MKENKQTTQQPDLEMEVTEAEEMETKAVEAEAAETEVSEEAVVEAEAVETTEVKEEAEEEAEEVTYKELSPIRLVLRRFFRSRLSIVGIVMIVALFLFSFLGPVIYTRWGEDTVDRTPIVQQQPPTAYEGVNESGDKFTITEVVDLDLNISELVSPSSKHFLGTDKQGMDIFVRLMFGGRISLIISFIVVILETLIGIVLGGISGYFGGWVDNIIMRIVDIFNCIPTLPILLIASAVIDSWHLTPDQQIYVLMAVITLFGWSGTARLVRGQILSLREQEYITATEVMGLSTPRRIFRHLVPNVMPQLIVSMTLGLGSVILYESTLSYLGLGVQLPKAAWGTMIAPIAKDTTILNYHWNVWVPAGILIVIAVLGFNFIGDGLRDAMDPKARK